MIGKGVQSLKGRNKLETIEKILMLCTCIIIGAAIIAMSDYLLGISFKDVPSAASVAHTSTYLLWGMCLAKCIDSFHST